jgi:hypothetical protein
MGLSHQRVEKILPPDAAGIQPVLKANCGGLRVN